PGRDVVQGRQVGGGPEPGSRRHRPRSRDSPEPPRPRQSPGAEPPFCGGGEGVPRIRPPRSERSRREDLDRARGGPRDLRVLVVELKETLMTRHVALALLLLGAPSVVAAQSLGELAEKEKAKKKDPKAKTFTNDDLDKHHEDKPEPEAEPSPQASGTPAPK